MRSRRPRTGSTRPSASTDPTPPGPGPTSTSSSSPPCRGCTGSTTTASTATATTCHPRSSKQRSTLPNRPTPSGLESNRPSLHHIQCGSDRAAELADLRWTRVVLEVRAEAGDELEADVGIGVVVDLADDLLGVPRHAHLA